MSERRFVLVDFTHMSRAGYLRLYEAGHTYALTRAIAHAATKRELVAKQRSPHWMPPSMFRLPEPRAHSAPDVDPTAMHDISIGRCFASSGPNVPNSS